MDAVAKLVQHLGVSAQELPVARYEGQFLYLVNSVAVLRDDHSISFVPMPWTNDTTEE
jgi:hypothetical protein